MASAPTSQYQKSSSSDSESESEIESDSSEDSESTKSLSSFDQSEEDCLSSESRIEDPAPEQLQHEFEINDEKVLEIETTDISSCDLQRSGLTECENVLKELSLLIWDTTSNSVFISLLKDFVESEFFLIDGDSLLITCALNVNLKKGQTLHFFYIVEQFLHDFIQKEAKFLIVFFKDAENLYFNFPELLALRSALIQHLEYNTDVTIHTEFSNCLSSEWELFLKECSPYFLIVSETGLTARQTHFLNIFIIHALQKKINIVLSSRLETDTLRTYGYHASSCYSHIKFFKMHEKQLQHALHAYIIDYFQKSQETGVVLYSHLKLSLEDMQKERKYRYKKLSELYMLQVFDDPDVAFFSKKREFDELTHWHSSRPLSDDFERTKCNSDENQKRQLAKLEKKEEERWKNLSLAIERGIKENPNFGIKRLEDFLQICPVKSVKFTAEMAGLGAIFKLWMEHCKKPDAESKDISIVIQMMKRIHIIHEKYSELLQNVHRQKIAKYLKYIGFNNLADSLCPQESGTEKDISEYSVHMGAARFQLTHMGPYLFREERSDPDPRVLHFIPDTWQRELLDVVDNNESAVIVAPTSSGKTHASYYCMEKILRESNEGVVVYVSPTKALVNQVVGTVHNLFTKTLPKGLVVCGVFTRDYRHDTMNCQILVTVPQCLEILLLSPHYQKWVKRIRYVIFDEVHCLGGEIGAEVWEHLLVMIRCPFLALSATISNPKHLTEWLVLVKKYWQQVESKMENSGASQNAVECSKKQQCKRTENPSYRVRLVWYKERYNDLEKYVCSLKDKNFVIEHYHPCAALTVNHIQKYGFPVDLGFSPRESILLYDAMVHIWPEWSRRQELDPEEFNCFKNKVVIRRTDAKKYEEELKREMICWIQLDPDKVNELLKYLKPQTFDSAESEKRIMFPYFVEKLKGMERLPAIFFSFINSDSGARIQRLILWESEIKEIKENLKKYNEVSPDCTYIDHTVVDNQTLKKILHRLKGTRQCYKLYAPLQRGIGYHHASMEYKQRQVVEMLFRLGHVKVVTATSSLALGINMPCKSVVFMEDSVYLDALHFRQMSGRAGRHGEDLIGNVFFYDVPLPKIERLLRSNVPKLKGQFPISLTLVLRLMLLAAKADDKEDAKAKVLSLLQYSLMSFKQPKIKCMLKFYFIYSLQFLVTEGYLDQECVPMGYSGLVSHLHYHEPANFVLVRFLEKGLFHKLCTPVIIDGQKRFSEDTMETLVVVLANLFGRRYFPPCVKKLKKKNPQSVAILDNLPKDFAIVVKEYNDRIQNNFGSFLLTISKLADMRKEYQLPLSEIDFSVEKCEDSELVSHLMPGVESRTAISPFACLSNITDQDLFDTDVLNDAVLRTVNVYRENIPFLKLNKYDMRGKKCSLNAYALNFYKHGSLLKLTSENRLNMGDAFNLIRDFVLTIQSIRISLSELCDDKDDNVVLAFKQLSDAFNAKLKKKGRQ
nr:probable ATP-dependent RNA helicase DDX60 [Dasypus novemcinctus]